ncbi:ubiquitin C-terminal hydrolase Ubp2 [Crucibulum laeve]|uniref:ubiquitinyl hydrolase 1 n=1 Tax=Crucibulum laeve TaxID=68775 RepID=A0A5C3M9N9_9AGAR|nr:ubiquitin C-terminal hydrolase Ubp2 [Crucibulum laeve]
MDNSKEPPKARRPLPTPGMSSYSAVTSTSASSSTSAPLPSPAQRPNTPVMGAPQSISPASFYGTSTKVPPLPTRPKNVGSNLTAYIPPESPPRYSSPSFNKSTEFREPELVRDVSDEDIPALVPHDERWWNNGGSGTDSTMWEAQTTSVADWTMDTTGYGKQTEVTIGGRDGYEESHWWDAELRERSGRPGPGMLPPVLAEALHDSEHSLHMVSVNMPDIPLPSTAMKGPPATPPTPAVASGSSTPALPPTSTTPPLVQPTEEEVRTAVPHPNAYYCPKENGWVLLSWKSSTIVPPLAKSFLASKHRHLPDQERRKKIASCIGEGHQPFGQVNKTHHFHHYEKAVDARKLTPPFIQDDWEMAEVVKQKRRGGTIVLEDFDLEKIEAESLAKGEEDEDEGKLLDLYMCCQCSFYCVASGLIPGVLPRRHFEEFIRDKRQNPSVGKTGEQAVVLALETILLAIENKLWKGEKRMIKIGNVGFQTKIGWNPNIKRIFETLGFTEEHTEDIALRPPVTDTTSPTGKLNRRKLLRAWVEMGAWLADNKRIHAAQFKDLKMHTIYAQIESARETYQTSIGAHPDQIPRNELNDTLMTVLRPLTEVWEGLGLTPTTYTAELLAFAYLAQCRCDPANTMVYFTYFSTIVKIMQNHEQCPAALQELLVMEQSRDRFALEDIYRAAEFLGFGHDGALRVEYDDEIPDEFVENAWKDCVKRSWRDPVNGSGLQRDANEALRILAEARGSAALRRAWEAGKNRYMNPDKAFDTLEIPRDVGDDMLITVFNMRLEETPLQMDKMREALLVIAEIRDSERLRQFLSTGQDPGEVVAPTRPDLPRGLNQLGNTCYLNSLLQYFYTIKDLRAAVSPMSKLDLASLEEEKLSDDELKRHRVGGRLVTRREIVRSRKFISQLADLFMNLEYAETAAVTPTLELAKLALVTSKDEEEDEADGRGTDSSNDTDATLVDDGPSHPPALESQSITPPTASSTVLGKRPRDIDRTKSMMDVDLPTPEKEGYVMVGSPTGSSSPPPLVDVDEYPEASSSRLPDADGDIRMATPGPQQPAPPLPPRKRTEVSDSVMMFGRQHDVSECMDNCMFQIETALLKFGGMTADQSEISDKTSVVKRSVINFEPSSPLVQHAIRLFYGSRKQKLTDISDEAIELATPKNDIFSHLPVNVSDDGIDIYDGLSGYFDDIVEYEGKKARMEVSLLDLPPVLQIQLQRVQFNRETLQPYKSQAYVKFGEAIYMDRFMDNADPAKKVKSKTIQSELTACRERVRLLVEGKDQPFISALEHTSGFLSRLDDNVIPDVDAELVLGLQAEKELVREEIDKLRARIDELKEALETLWKDSTDVAYELTSVFIHRGSSPSWGHYFFYSRHLPEAPDSWFKYNDSDVTVVSKDEVLADTTGSTANPYLLVFARKGADVVDTVNRVDVSVIEDS